MSKSVADVMKMVKDNDVKFVDFRFTDTRGKEQHVSVPVSHFDEDKFTSGHAFDGSSIAGWKGIEASDMLLMPDANTANIDPFFEEPTLILTCDVIEPGDGKPYERDPRSLAKRAEAYMRASGLGDTAYFGPEPEFFIFDSVRWGNEMGGAFFEIEAEEAGVAQAGCAHVGLGPLGQRTRVALVGLAVAGLDHVAGQDQGRLFKERVDVGRVGIGHEQHVRGFNALPTGDG